MKNLNKTFNSEKAEVARLPSNPCLEHLVLYKFFTKLKDNQVILQNVFLQALYLINTPQDIREQVLTAVVAQ